MGFELSASAASLCGGTARVRIAIRPGHFPDPGIGVDGIPESRNTIRVGKMGFKKPRIFRFFKKPENVKVQNVVSFSGFFILSRTN
jgi:hypothetical protein